MTIATTAVLLLAVTAAVSLVTRILRVPYTVALVIAGLLVPRVHALPELHLTRELLYAVFLPGLLFEAAFHIDARRCYKDVGAIFALAVPGVALAICLTAPTLVWSTRALAWVPDLSWSAATVFAALIAATDPIAVVTLFRRLRASRRLEVIIEGESLVNDGTAVVLFTIALSATTGGHLGVANAVLEFARIFGLGVLVGAALGFAISRVIALVDDPVLEITLTMLAAYGSFILAEELHVSGVLATVAAGMVTGTYGLEHGMNPPTRVAVQSFWDYVAFALNSLVFLLIGMQITVRRLLGQWDIVLLAYASVMVARAAIVFLVIGVLRRTSQPIPWRWGAVLTWGGLRGALSMVLAAALPVDFPERELVVTVTFGVVVLSILCNGLTVGPLLRAMGLIRGASGGTLRESVP